jgi:hypothetical protein
MKEIYFGGGLTIDQAWKKLLNESAESGETCFGKFNGKEIYSTDTLDEAYVKIIGKTKAEYDKEMQDWRDEYDRKEKEHKDNIPNLVPGYCEKARGVILEDQYDYWDKIVPIRLGDLYHGMELDCTLDLCKIMRDESMSYDKRLRKAYKTFMDQGHSGMSAGLVAHMLRAFCPDGNDLADAVMNFRFEKK